jgi:hypothetical protein
VQVVNGAQLMCSFGTSPSSLVVLPVNRVLSSDPRHDLAKEDPEWSLYTLDLKVVQEPVTEEVVVRVFRLLDADRHVHSVQWPTRTRTSTCICIRRLGG